MIDRNTIAARVERFSRARRGVLNATTGYRLGRFALIAGVFALLLLGGSLPNFAVNALLFAMLGCFLLILATVGCLRYVRFPSHLEEAFHLEKLAGNLNSRIVSAWDFLDRNVVTPLTRAVIERAGDDLQQNHEARLDRSARNLQRKHFLGWLTVFLVLGLTPWFGFGRLAENWSHTWLALEQYLFPIHYTLEPGAGTYVHRLGTPVELGLHFRRPPHSPAKMVVQSGDETKEFDVSVAGDGWARHTITSDVEAEQVIHFEFGVSGSPQRTEDVTLVFTSPPALVNMQTELLYPPYTRLLPRSLEGVQQRLLGLPGTRMTLGFTFSKDLASAEIAWDDGQTLPLETTGRFATVSLMHNRARQATLQVRDIHGFTLDVPLVIEFAVQVDEKPQVFLPGHLKEDMPLLEATARLFSFGVQAQDDFGVTRLVLRWQKSTVDAPTSIQERGEVERLISPEQPKVIVNFDKVFANLPFKPGDKVTFQVEAHDNRRPERQTTVSRRCSFFIFQEELAGLMVKELGFGKGAEFARERIAKSTRLTAVKEPEGIKTKENVRNEFEANIASPTQSPTVRGEHGQATRDYFRLLSTVKYPDEPKDKK
jgi:hypothetical protein